MIVDVINELSPKNFEIMRYENIPTYYVDDIFYVSEQIFEITKLTTLWNLTFNLSAF